MIAAELIGQNLYNMVFLHCTLTEDDKKSIAINVAQALKYLQDENVVHGNLTPFHILTSQRIQTHVKLTDFKQARLNSDAPDAALRTEELRFIAIK